MPHRRRILQWGSKYLGMTKHTSRDAVWNYAMQYAVAKECFKLDEIRSRISERVSDRTIRDTLNTMVDQGWLSKETAQSHGWGPGSYVQDGDNIERRDFPQDPVPNVADVSTLEQGEVYVGVVKRFSSSGNANVKLPSHMDRTYINLGPIDVLAREEPVRFKFLETGWGECLVDAYTYDGYDPRDGMKHSSTYNQLGSDSLTSSASSSSSSASSSSSSKRNPIKGSYKSSKNDLLGGDM